jgi:hypothetical protein
MVPVLTEFVIMAPTYSNNLSSNNLSSNGACSNKVCYNGACIPTLKKWVLIGQTVFTNAEHIFVFITHKATGGVVNFYSDGAVSGFRRIDSWSRRSGSTFESYNATGSLTCFGNTLFSSNLKKCLLKRWCCSVVERFFKCRNTIFVFITR